MVGKVFGDNEELFGSALKDGEVWVGDDNMYCFGRNLNIQEQRHFQEKNIESHLRAKNQATQENQFNNNKGK